MSSGRLDGDNIFGLRLREVTELRSLPLEFINAWSHIPVNIKEQVRFLQSTIEHTFKNQPAPESNRERNDDYYKEIFDLNITNIRIELEPVKTEFWRLGFSFLKSKEFPHVNEGRYFDQDKTDIHLEVGELSDGIWALPQHIGLKENRTKTILSEFSEYNKYKGEKITLSLTPLDKLNKTWSIEILLNNSSPNR